MNIHRELGRACPNLAVKYEIKDRGFEKVEMTYKAGWQYKIIVL